MFPSLAVWVVLGVVAVTSAHQYPERVRLDETVSLVQNLGLDWYIAPIFLGLPDDESGVVPRCGELYPNGNRLGDYVLLAVPHRKNKGLNKKEIPKWSVCVAKSDTTLVWETQTTDPFCVAMSEVGNVGLAEQISRFKFGLRVFDNLGTVIFSRVWSIDSFPEYDRYGGNFESEVFSFSPDSRFLIYCFTPYSEESIPMKEVLWVYDLSTGEEWSMDVGSKKLDIARFQDTSKVKLYFREKWAPGGRFRIEPNGDRPFKILDLEARCFQ